MIEVRATGLVNRNPRPELRSFHTWHPSIVRFDDGELVCVFDGASADQALDYRAYVTRSADGGAKWSKPERVLADRGDRPTTHLVRASRLSDGSLVGVVGRMFRDDPEQGIVNTPGIGYADMDLWLTRSADRGRTWSAPERIDPPVVGPSWEICHAIVELRDGRWLLPLASWMGWHGDAADGMRSMAFESTAGPRTSSTGSSRSSNCRTADCSLSRGAWTGRRAPSSRRRTPSPPTPRSSPFAA